MDHYIRVHDDYMIANIDVIYIHIHIGRVRDNTCASAYVRARAGLLFYTFHNGIKSIIRFRVISIFQEGRLSIKYIRRYIREDMRTRLNGRKGPEYTRSPARNTCDIFESDIFFNMKNHPEKRSFDIQWRSSTCCKNDDTE